jgi:hypothetical protein
MSTPSVSHDRRVEAWPADQELARIVARNRLLDALAGEARETLAPHLERVTLEIGDTLARAGERWGMILVPAPFADENAADQESTRGLGKRVAEVIGWVTHARSHQHHDHHHHKAG